MQAGSGCALVVLTLRRPRMHFWLLPQDDGGGGGGGGWNWEHTARNLLPNVVFLSMYFLVTSYGGDGWNGGFFGEDSSCIYKCVC